MNRYALTLAAAVCTVSIAQAQTVYVTSNRTVANGSPLTNTAGTVNVGITSGGTLVPGVNADVVSPANFFLQARSTSSVQLQSGALTGFRLYNDAQLTISDGITGIAGTATAIVAEANDNSRLTVTGGTLHDGFRLQNTATGLVTGGTFNSIVSAEDNSRLTIQDGTFNGLRPSQSATIDVFGGVFRYSTVPSTQSGSPVPVATDVQGSATLNIYGGNFVAQNIRVFGTATNLNVSGGSIGRIEAFNNGTVSITGGILSNVLLCNFNQGGTPYGIFNLVGSNFALTNPRIFSFSDQYINAGSGTMYDISGTLADGNILSGRYFLQGKTVAQGPSGINFSGPAVVPETGTLALILPCLAVVGMTAGRRLLAKKKATILSQSTFAALAIASNAAVVHAQTVYINSDRTVANGNPINTAINNNLTVGRTSTLAEVPNVQVDVVSPANIAPDQSFQSMQVFSNSRVNFLGGDVGSLRVRGSANITINGGTIKDIQTTGVQVTPNVDIISGTVGTATTGRSLLLARGATGFLRGGFVSGVSVHGGASFTMSGGIIGQGGFDTGSDGADSVFTMTGGAIQAQANLSTSASLLGGNITGGIVVNNLGSATISNDFVVNEGVYMQSGSDTSETNIRGGTFGIYTGAPVSQRAHFYNVQKGTMNFFGTNLVLSAPTPGKYNVIDGNYYTFTSGVLEGGQDVTGLRVFDALSFNGNTTPYTGTINLLPGASVVPEANTAALLGLALSIVGVVNVVRRCKR